MWCSGFIFNTIHNTQSILTIASGYLYFFFSIYFYCVDTQTNLSDTRKTF